MTSHFKRNDDESRWEVPISVDAWFIHDDLLELALEREDTYEFMDNLVNSRRGECLRLFNDQYHYLQQDLRKIITDLIKERETNDRNPN